MALYALSDTHLSFAVNKPMDIFGSRWHNCENKLQKNWCGNITDNDTVVIPGDISWAMSLQDSLPDLQFLAGLPGKKIIGRGNHDYWWETVTKMNRFFGFDSVSFLFNNAFETDEFIVCGSRGWFNDEGASPNDTDYNKIVAREALRLDMSITQGNKLNPEKEKLVFLHFPPVFGSYICPELIDVMKKHSIKRCFFGHIHGNYILPPDFMHENIKFTLISADYLDFMPLKITKN